MVILKDNYFALYSVLMVLCTKTCWLLHQRMEFKTPQYKKLTHDSEQADD